MSYKLRLQRRQLPLYIFLVFYFYLFIFQYISRSYIDEAGIIVAIPLLTLVKRESMHLKKYMMPAILMFLLIIAWSTESHKSFIYYFIMVEVFFFIRPDTRDLDLIIGVVKRTAFVNAFFVLVSRVFPRLMIQYARLVFSSDIANGYIIAMQRGYYAGINNQVAFAAVYIALGIFAYMYDKRENGRGRIVKLAILWLTLIMTNKRSHFIYLLVVMFFVYYISARKGRKFDRAIKLVFIAFILLGLLYLATFFLPSVPILRRLQSVISIFTEDADANVVLSGRVSIYNQVLNLFLRNKVMGIGWQNFADFSIARSMSGGINQGHNVFLQLLCETGIVGFILFFLINLYYLFFNLHTNEQFINGRGIVDESIDRKLLDAGRNCSVAFMIFYYMFWFSGNALYDFTFVYTWVLAILLGQTINLALAK